MIRLIQGAVRVDDRGSVSFVNDFGFEAVKRSYLVSNHKAGYVRAWHAHKREAKYVWCLKGSALVCAVEIDNWENPSPGLKVNRQVLSDRTPAVLYIPAGFANGFMSLSEDMLLMFFSTSSLDESLNDDFRFDARLWDPWQIEER